FVLSRRGGGGGGGAAKMRSARPMEPEVAPSEEPAPVGEEPMPEEAPLPNGDAMWEEPPAPADMNNDGMSD
ncbi:MAG TPA: hypothetical protein VGV64_06030, partial [Thermoplasmata archaeon]|nr:hypothetical protein [Thermoplasmata archaeon]